MVAEAQRNVIISLKLAADPKNQATADLVVRQAQNVSVAGVNSLRNEEEEHTRTEAGKTKVHAEQSNKRIDKALKEKEKREKAAKELTNKIREAEKTRVESHQKANEAGLVAVQGLADMAEGAAKLGLVTEENFETFARHFVIIQSGMQVFKGATDLFWKGREALIALSAATNAQTAANNLMAASNVRVAGTGVAGAAGGRGAGIAGQAVAGVAGGAAVKGGSALGGGVVLAKLGGLLAIAAAGGLALHDTLKAVASGFDKAALHSDTMTGAILGWIEAANEAEESTKQLAKAEQNRQALIRERTKVEQIVTDRIDLQGQHRGAGNRANEAVAFAAGESNIEQADRLRLDAIREVRAAEQEIIEQRNLAELRQEKGRFNSQKLAVKVLKDLESAQGRLLDADKNRLSVLRQQNEATAAQLKDERIKLVTLQEAKRLEDQSLRAKLGQFSPGLQKRTIEIAEKIKAGEQINRRDVAILQEAGVGQKQINDFFENKGRGVAGSSTFTEVFGTKSRAIKEAEFNERDTRKKLISGQKEESAAGTQVESSAALFKQFNEVRVKQEAVLKGVLKEQFDGLNQENLIQNIQQAAADAADAINQQGMVTINSIQSMQEVMINSHQEMQKQFDNFKLDTNWNQQT